MFLLENNTILTSSLLNLKYGFRIEDFIPLRNANTLAPNARIDAAGINHIVRQVLDKIQAHSARVQ
jgi:hypothetical protein